MNRKKIAAVLVSATLSMSMLAGCGSKSFDLEKYGDKTLMTVDGTSMSFWEANFQARLLQTQYESAYGTDIWSQTVDGDETFETSTKEVLLDGLKTNLAALNHAKDYDIELTDEEKKSLSAQAENFLEQITDEFKDLTSPDQEKVEQYLENTVIIQKVASAVEEEADITVTDEEARQMKANYVVFKVDSDATSSEKAAIKKQATKLMNAAKKSNSLAQAAKASDLEVKEATYGSNNEEIPSEIIEASMSLKKNEITQPIETDYGYYVIQCVKYNDKDATKTAKEDMISDKKLEYYSTTSQGWVEDSEVEVDEELWNTIEFANHPTIETTEATTETSTQEDSTDSSTTTESTSEQTTNASKNTTDSKQSSESTTAATTEQTTSSDNN